MTTAGTTIVCPLVSKSQPGQEHLQLIGFGTEERVQQRGNRRAAFPVTVGNSALIRAEQLYIAGVEVGLTIDMDKPARDVHVVAYAVHPLRDHHVSEHGLPEEATKMVEGIQTSQVLQVGALAYLTLSNQSIALLIHLLVVEAVMKSHLLLGSLHFGPVFLANDGLELITGEIAAESYECVLRQDSAGATKAGSSQPADTARLELCGRLPHPAFGLHVIHQNLGVEEDGALGQLCSQTLDKHAVIRQSESNLLLIHHLTYRSGADKLIEEVRLVKFSAGDSA